MLTTHRGAPGLLTTSLLLALAPLCCCVSKIGASYFRRSAPRPAFLTCAARAAERSAYRTNLISLITAYLSFYVPPLPPASISPCKYTGRRLDLSPCVDASPAIFCCTKHRSADWLSSLNNSCHFVELV